MTNSKSNTTSIPVKDETLTALSEDVKRPDETWDETVKRIARRDLENDT